MTTQTLSRGLFALPILGWIAHDIAHKGEENIYYALVILLTVLALAVKTWGLVALGLTGVAMVPVMMVLLIAITRG